MAVKKPENYKRKLPENPENENKTGRYQLKASAKYDKEKVDNIRLRVPAGWKEKMQQYAKETGYSSMNAFLVDLIRREIKIEE
jgi:hypothetical protein